MKRLKDKNTVARMLEWQRELEKERMRALGHVGKHRSKWTVGDTVGAVLLFVFLSIYWVLMFAHEFLSR